MLVGFFKWFVQDPNVGHKICILNEKNDDDKKIKNRRNKIIVINKKRKQYRTRKRKRIQKEKK
jgi:hypothetical protein